MIVIPSIRLKTFNRTQKKTENVKEKETGPAPKTSQVLPSYSHTLNAPLVGTFYSSSGPGKNKLVSIGDAVKKGDKICIVEAMKLFNEIEAIEDCIIQAILVNDGDGVKKDQPLVAYEPA